MRLLFNSAVRQFRSSAIWLFGLLLISSISLSQCTTPAGATLTESFGDSAAACGFGSASSCNSLWAVGAGSGATIAASPAGAPANTACANSLKMVTASGAQTFIYQTGAFPRITAGQSATWTFELYVSSNSMAAFDMTTLLAPTVDNGSTGPVILFFRYDGTNLQLQADGSTVSNDWNISLNAWHTVLVHVGSGTNQSWMNVDNSSNQNFTENSTDVTYLTLGSTAAGNEDVMTYYIGNLKFDSAAGAQTSPSAFVDFEAGTNGNAIATADLVASTHCGNGSWSIQNPPSTGLAYSTSGQFNLSVPVTACRTNYPGTGSLGLQWNMASAPSGNNYPVADYSFTTSQGSASFGKLLKVPNVPATDANFYTLGFLEGAGAADKFGPELHGDGTHLHLNMETQSGSLVNGPQVSPLQLLWLTGQYVAGGTHTLKIYDAISCALLSTLTTAATGNHLPTDLLLGRAGSEAGHPSDDWWYDNVVLDYNGAAFPLAAPTCGGRGYMPARVL